MNVNQLRLSSVAAHVSEVFALFVGRKHSNFHIVSFGRWKLLLTLSQCFLIKNFTVSENLIEVPACR